MARTRAMQDLATDALRLADLENAANRFPNTPGGEVYEYVNKAIAHVLGAITQAEDRPHRISEAFTQVASAPEPAEAFSFPLPLDCSQLLEVAWSSGQTGPYTTCDPYQSERERTELMSPGYTSGSGYCRFHYGYSSAQTGLTQGTIPVSYGLDLVPNPPLGSWLRVRYVPVPPRLLNALDFIDTDYEIDLAVATWAAILMRRKDDLDTTELRADFALYMDRVLAIAKRRDRSRPPKTTIVRGWGTRGRRIGRGRW